MKHSIILELIQNIAILLSFAVLFNYLWSKTDESKKWYFKILSGLIIGGIGIVLMLTPWTLYPGLVFDTRSILLAVSGIFFGAIPTIVAIFVIGLYRIFMGGDGMLMGVAVIVSSGAIGIIWRLYRLRFEKQNYFLLLYILGFIVHAAMLACTLFLPAESALKTFKTIFWPVMIIYPLGTMLLGALMYKQEKNRLMQKSLNESEERWKFALEGSGDGLWDWNKVTNEVFFSHQWKAMLGYEDHEIENALHEWDSRLHFDDKEKVYRDLNRYLDGETEVFISEHRLLCKDGSYKWILDRGKVIEWSPEKKPVRVIGIHTDISERKIKDEIIKQNEIRNQMILDTAMDGFWIVNTKGKIIEINEVYSRLSGYTKEELLEMNVSDLEINDSKTEVDTRMENIVQTGRDKFESIHKKKNGDLWDVEVNMEYLKFDNGIFVTFIRDITDRKKIENELKESEEKFRTAFISSPDSVNINKLDDGMYIDINDGFTQIMEYEWDDVIGKKSTELIIWDNNEDRLKLVEGLKKHGFVENLEARFRSKSGKLKYGLMSANLIKLKDVPHILSITRDITERKNTETELKEYRENLEGIVKERTQSVEEQALKLKESQKALLFLLEDINESRDQLEQVNGKLELANKEMEAFSYSVSHDLRAPLTRLDGFSTAIFDMYKDKLDEKGKHYLTRIKASSRKMEQLIEDLLSLSRISRQEISKSVVNISGIADKILKGLNRVDPQRKVIVKIEKSIEINCDAKLITILLQNMLSNAWKFTSKNEESIIEVGTRISNNKTVVFIKDNGVGFEMKYVDKVFLPFQRLHTESEFEGTGIGMATVHRIVKRHDAEISVESKIGEGTIFYLSF